MLVQRSLEVVSIAAFPLSQLSKLENEILLHPLNVLLYIASNNVCSPNNSQLILRKPTLRTLKENNLLYICRVLRNILRYILVISIS